MTDTRIMFFLQVTSPKVVALLMFGSSESERSVFTGCLVGCGLDSACSMLCYLKGPQHVRSNAVLVQCLSATKRPGETLTTYIENVWSCNSTHPHALWPVGDTSIHLKQRKFGKTRPENSRRNYE